jgi:hypothetical protein
MAVAPLFAAGEISLFVPSARASVTTMSEENDYVTDPAAPTRGRWRLPRHRRRRGR